MTNSIISPELPEDRPATRQRITDAWLRDEADAMTDLLEQAELPADASDAVQDQAADLVQRVREESGKRDPIARFMQEYDLSSEEGILLMCIAEALQRIPDKTTADHLIRNKLGDADWAQHLGDSKSVLVNASTWSLMMTGKLSRLPDATRKDFGAALQRVVDRMGEPVVRKATREAVRIMGEDYILAPDIEKALERTEKKANKPYRFSFDMLGEVAVTWAATDMYMQAYSDAIAAIGEHDDSDDVLEAPSISVKLTALHPRYELAQRERVMAELTPRLLKLAQEAMANGIGLNVDAEEASRLELALDVVGSVFADPSLEGWNGMGIVLQAYQKRTPMVIDWLAEKARDTGRRWHVRLVKGAYWDAEIKVAQQQGLSGFPVYTRKPNTDVSYLACARRMLDAGEDLIYPQFATHNAHTIAAVHHMADGRAFEYQRLYGMGAGMYEQVMDADGYGAPCRVYAPVGGLAFLLPYLVRRLLENGANTSFMNHVTDEYLAIDELVGDPCRKVREFDSMTHPNIRQPIDIYNEVRKNSQGVNLASENELATLAQAANAHPGPWQVAPLVPGADSAGERSTVINPADQQDQVGSWQNADEATVHKALDNAEAAATRWDETAVETRVSILEQAAGQLESRRGEFVAMCVREAGKSISASIDEVREAADFLRYYATMGRRLFGTTQSLPGPTGESNEMALRGQGIFVCISPWNFPLAIFTGQVSAALAAGNAVIAKPAEQSTLIAGAMVGLLHAAGIPEDVLQFVPGGGDAVGPTLTADPRLAGVAFTGSTGTAHAINKTLAQRDAPIGTLIAETGGQNAMIADSSSLPEQLVPDVIHSAFDSAGQRCSACRVLYLQEDVADRIIEMLAGAMRELTVGDPALLSSDVGPVIDADALAMLQEHVEWMERDATKIAEVPLSDDCQQGNFLAPRAYEIPSLDMLEDEVFGPILHVVRYKTDELDRVIDEINATGYGLTLGVHSRVDETWQYIADHVHVGNCYVNRDQVGSIVGSQPFGGEGLSGTGFKAGGPNYLLRFATERVLTVNTTAAGGNASLLAMGDD